MSENDELEQRRQAIIERIKEVFPKNPPEKLKLIDGWDLAAGERLHEMLNGKAWEEVIGHKSVIYNLSEVDHLRELTEDAYYYYLPAFLVATLNDPEYGFYYGYPFEIMVQRLAKFSREQIDVSIAYLRFFSNFAVTDVLPDYDFIKAIEATLVRLLSHLDELSSQEK